MEGVGEGSRLRIAFGEPDKLLAHKLGGHADGKESLALLTEAPAQLVCSEIT